jgi:hypothetical protein
MQPPKFNLYGIRTVLRARLDLLVLLVLLVLPDRRVQMVQMVLTAMDMDHLITKLVTRALVVGLCSSSIVTTSIQALHTLK